MADPQITLDQFIKNALSKLEGQDPDAAKEILLEIKFLYPDIFSQFQEQQILSFLDNPTKLNAKLLDSLRELESRPEQVKRSLSDELITPQDAAARAKIYTQGEKKAAETLTALKKHKNEKLADFARRLGNQYTTNVRKALKKDALSNEQVTRIESSAENIATTAASIDDLRTLIDEAPEIPREIKTAAFARAMDQPKSKYDTAAYRYERVSAVIARTRGSYFSKPNPPLKTTVLFEKAMSLAMDPDHPNAPIEKAVKLAEKATRFAEAVDADTGAIRLDLPEYVVKINFDKAMTAVVNSPQFLQLSRAGGATQKQSAGGFFGGLFSSATSILDSTKAPPNEDMILYLQAIYEKQRISGGDIQPNAHEYAVSSHYANHPALFHFEPGASPFNWMLRFGAKKGSEEAIAGAVAKTGLGAWSKEAITGLGVKFLTGIGAPAWLVGLGGGPVGWVIFGATVVLPYVWNYLGKALSGFSAGAFGFVQASTGAFAGYVASLPGLKPYKEDRKLLWTIGGLVAAVFLLPMLATFATMSVNKAALVPSEGIGAGGMPINCATEPDKSSPMCVLTQCKGDCKWPLDNSSGACIIEGPFVGTHSKCRLSGIDFITLGGQGKLFGAPVYSPYAGTVERAVFGYDDNSGYAGNQDGGTYGNNIMVRTSDGGHLLFAHLRNIQTVKEGDTVAAKTVVGFVDHTGYSLGVHLHYEAWEPGCPKSGVDINKYTPFPVPPCEGYADCNSKLRAAGYSACL